MPYVEGGVVKEKRPIWRLSTLVETFLAILHYIVAFVKTMFSMDASNAYRKRPKGDRRGSGSGGGWDDGAPPGGPGGNPKRFGGMSNIKGIDHTASPSCGSCCG